MKKFSSETATVLITKEQAIDIAVQYAIDQRLELSEGYREKAWLISILVKASGLYIWIRSLVGWVGGR